MRDVIDYYSTLKKLDFRDAIFEPINKILAEDTDAVLLTNDLGAVGLAESKRVAEERVVNVGISEQNLMSVAGGLAQSGKFVFAYGILPHLIFRALEQIKLDICVQQLPVCILGVGAGLSYGVDGPTHLGVEDVGAVRCLPNVSIYCPSDYYSASFSVSHSYLHRQPSIIRLDKENFPGLHEKSNLRDGYVLHRVTQKNPEGRTILVCSGITVWLALSVQKELESEGMEIVILELTRLKPIQVDSLVEVFETANHVLIIDEHVPNGGLFEIMLPIVLRARLANIPERIGLQDEYHLGSAHRDSVWAKNGMTIRDLCEKIMTIR